MQKIDPPAGGDHNPNSYTADEIIAALKGSTGSRQFSFRYEQLDENNVKLADLVTVKSGKINQNWLADIKRTASFTLTTGPEDNIDYLKHRIKPWVRLHMPAKAIPQVSTEEPPVVVNPPHFGALVDDFSTGSPTAFWSSYTNGAINTGGFLNLPAMTPEAQATATSNSVWSLTGSQVAAELNTVPFVSGGPLASTRMRLGPPASGFGLAIEYNQATNNMAFMNITGNNDTSPVTAAYDSTNHRWLRIRENNGTVFWESSATGLPGTWTIHRILATPSWVTSSNNFLKATLSSSVDLTPTFNYADNFSRSVTGSWGTNETTGYTYAGQGANLTNWHVAPGTGRFNLTATPSATRHQITQSSTQFQGNIDQRVTLKPLGGVTTGASLLPGLTARFTSVTDFYTARVHFNPTGFLFCSIWRGQGGQQGASVALNIPYTAATLVHLRMQVQGHTVRARVWIDSTAEPTSWNIERTITDTPIDTGRYGVFMGGFSGNTNTNYDVGYSNYRASALTAADYPNTPALWDNINLTPQGTSTAFMPQAEWTNTFNGTPGVTGEDITPNNSARTGNALDSVSGVVQYSDTFSVDLKKSAKLGDDAGVSDGEMVVKLANSVAEWSLRTYFKVAAGAKLTITADGVSPDTTNDIIVDDDSGLIKFGTITPPLFIQAQLIGVPVKLEIITEATLTTYRAFWTSVDSTNPDYVVTESNVGRPALSGLTFIGGGSTTPPVYVDNVTLSVPAVQQRFTDDSVNYVEWPQGVFLLSSPQRNSDEADVVTRDIQGYDLAQVLVDDLVPDRFTTANLLRVNDNFTRAVTGEWGTSADGTVWVNNAVANTVMGVNLSGYGFQTIQASPSSIRLQQAGNTSRQVLTDSEVYARLGVDQLALTESLLPAIVFRIAGPSDFYRLRVHHAVGGAIFLSVARNGTQYGSTVSTIVTYTPGSFLNVRAQVIGHVVRGRVWADGAKEPAGWQIEEEIDVPADQIDSGFTGLSSSAFAGNTNTNPQFRYDLFQLNPNPANTYTGVVEAILDDLNLPNHITKSPAILPTVREWEAGTSKREIVNDLLAAINYESLSFDEDGFALVRPYISPQDRAAEFRYVDDELSIMYPEVMHELDLFKIPNRWVLSLSDPDRDPVTVVFTNNDPASPTSTVRRGRTITEFMQNQDADSEATMILKANRAAFEASQVYEAVEFDSGLMPVHSGNDVFDVVYDPLGLNAKYVEHSWDMALSAGAKMSHRVRRVIPLTASSDPSLVTDDVNITGALEAGNMAWGTINIVSVANKPTRGLVTGLNLQGRGPVRVWVTAQTVNPGNSFMEVTAFNPSSTGFEVWVYRTNAVSTTIGWLAIRGA